VRDTLSPVIEPLIASDIAKAESLHAMGSFYVRQGFPKQGLSLLLAAHKFTVPSLELNRAIAHAYILSGVPQKALAMLEALAPTLETDAMRRAAARLRARALLAMGQGEQAKAAFAESTEQPAKPMRQFKVVGRSA